MKPTGLPFATLAFTLIVLGLGARLAGADDLKVQRLRTQEVNGTTYFQVQFEPPKDYSTPQLSRFTFWWQSRSPELALLPRLVPQDSQTRQVYLQLRFSKLEFAKGPGPWTGDPELDGLTFLGMVTDKKPARLLLLYPTGQDAARKAPKDKVKEESALVRLLRQRGSWAEAEVVLDFSKAKKVDFPAGGFNRPGDVMPKTDDLEGRWALSQGAAFAVQERLSPGAGFYAFAREATARKYKVPSLSLFEGGRGPDPDQLNRRLFELTTGADAIAESMALRRMRERNFRDKGERIIEISKLQGIDIAEHPWEKMMAGKKPAPEPLARLVPHDNYYLHFKSIVKFLDIGDLMDQWGTTLTRAFEVNSRDYHLKDRLEEQLCLGSTGLARIFGPAVIKGVAITGSDPYIREGSDVTVIFHLANKKAFQRAVEVFIDKARKKWGGNLAEAVLPLGELSGITVEEFKTPRREVSLYRAFVDDFAIYGNSQVGMRRVLEAYRGKRKALADSLDFQYMRTAFRMDDPKEDGFLFLSDPFLRNLVGPALRLKERRRLEGLTSLYMATHAALFLAWETGKLPEHHNALLAQAGLKAEELFSPDGPAIFWDAEQKQAFSGVYNTLQFATPLIELPIDKVTEQEERDYNAFRSDYLGLWRQYFDPVGLRVSISKKQARVELYILPLVKSSAYNDLQRRTGGGTIPLDPTRFGAKTVAQLVAHISPQAPERGDVAQLLRLFGRDLPGLNWLGDWVMVRLDDSDVYAKLAELTIRRELETEINGDHWGEEFNLFFQVPLTVGVQVKNRLVFSAFLTAVRAAVMDTLPDGIDWEPMKPAYKGVTLVRIRAKGGLPGELVGKDGTAPAIYYALVEDGWYASLSEASLKELIDRAVERKEGKAAPTKEAVPVNVSLYVSPKAAVVAKGFLRFYLEWETHKRTLDNLGQLLPLYRAGLLAPEAPSEKVEQVAQHFLGFAPVSADLVTFQFDSKRQEVINRRHGSVRQPRLNPGVEPNSPLGRLLEEFRSIRADLRFQEDGVNTVITFDRAGK
jgi:hypothetical protein